jgi:5-methylcytosine-specific restriction endonuclease McrA
MDKKILRRDKRCRLCGSKKNLTIHHIFPKGSPERYKDENLTVLCRQCHNLVNYFWNKKDSEIEGLRDAGIDI